MSNARELSQLPNTPLGFKNRIINGSFHVNQRAVSGTVTLAAGVYGHDRWKAGASGCTYTFSTTANVTTLTITAGSLLQVIEGVNLDSGTYCLSWTGTAQGKIGAGSYGASGITGAVTGGSNLNIELSTGTLSRVQLEVGTVPTVFDFEDYTTLLTKCQRYYYVGPSGSYGYPSPSTGGFAMNQRYDFKVTMRATPTVSTSYSSLSNVSSVNAGTRTADFFVDQIISTGQANIFYTVTYTATAEL